MTLTREDRQVLRAGLPAAWFALGCGLATTLGTIWGLRSYGTDLLHAAHELLPDAPPAELRTPVGPAVHRAARPVDVGSRGRPGHRARQAAGGPHVGEPAARPVHLGTGASPGRPPDQRPAVDHGQGGLAHGALGLATGAPLLLTLAAFPARCSSKTSAAGWALDSRCSPCWSAPCGCSRFDSCV